MAERSNIILSGCALTGEWLNIRRAANAIIQRLQPVHFIPFLLRKFPSVLQPALRRNLIQLRIDILGPEDASGKGNHARDMNPNGAITTAAKHTVSPDNALHLRQKLPVYLTVFSV
jgi:hypothetical protein